MQFLYVFSLMFLSIFGLAVLVKLAAYAVMTAECAVMTCTSAAARISADLSSMCAEVPG